MTLPFNLEQFKQLKKRELNFEECPKCGAQTTKILPKYKIHNIWADKSNTHNGTIPLELLVVTCNCGYEMYFKTQDAI